MGAQWVGLMVLAKTGAPERVGQYSLAIAVTSPVIIFSQLQLRAIQATDARNQFLFGHYLGLRIITTIGAIVVIIGIVALSKFQAETSVLILLMAIAKSVEAIGDTFHGFLQQRECMDRIAKSQILRGTSSATALFGGLYYFNSLIFGLSLMILAWVAVLVGYDVRNSSKVMLGAGELDHRTLLRPRWERQPIVAMTLLSLPLGLAMMLTSTNVNIPRYFIENGLGTRQLGFFAAVASLQQVGVSLASALAQAASPRLAKAYAVGDRRAFTRLLTKLVVIGITIAVAGVIVSLVGGRMILGMLFGEEYAVYANLLNWLMLASGIWSVTTFLGTSATVRRKFYYQLFILIVVNVVMTVACWQFTRTYGLNAVAIAATVTAAVGLGFYLIEPLLAQIRIFKRKIPL
jgi:O-antigen/teichoic acid export membrane protein